MRILVETPAVICKEEWKIIVVVLSVLSEQTRADEKIKRSDNSRQ
jgi:hypothetical protein